MMVYGYSIFDKQLNKFSAPVFLDNDTLAYRWFCMHVSELMKSSSYKLIVPHLICYCVCSFNLEDSFIETCYSEIASGPDVLKSLEGDTNE